MMTEKLVRIGTRPCLECGKTGVIEMPAAAYKVWQNGELIQVAWPDSTAAERELLLTGTHINCWDKLFPEEEEGDS